MNPNADYLGIVTKIAARLRVQLGADIIISL